MRLQRERFLDGIDDTLARLEASPYIGRKWESPNAPPGVRFRTVRGFRNYLVFYRPIPGGIEAIRLIHAAPNADA